MIASRTGLTILRAQVDARAAHCDLCPLDCGVDRIAGVRGVCGLARDARVFFAGVEHLEEPREIDPTFSIYTAGCNLRCAFCAAGAEVAVPGDAPRGDVEACVRAFRRAASANALRSVSFCGGEPSVALPTVLDLVSALETDLPLVWNSNLVITRDLLAPLARVFDLFLPDLHFGNERCSRALGGGANYLETVRGNIEALLALGAKVRVRHLLRPGHLACCFLPAARWAAERGLAFDLLASYTPAHREIDSRRLDESEITAARAWLVELGLASEPCDVTEVFVDARGDAAFWQTGDAALGAARRMGAR